MKKVFFSFGFFLLLVYFINLTSFQEDKSQDILPGIANEFHEGLDQLTTEIEHYLQKAKALDNKKSSAESLRAVHLNTRLAFKRIEFLLEYFDRDGIKKFINGASLPKLEPNVPQIRIIAPSGLQTLEELVFSEEPFESKEEIVELATQLQKKYSEISIHQRGIKLQHRYIFEAARQELVRIFTLGITGFDTPGSANAIPEALQAVAGINRALNHYFPLLESKSPVLQKELSNLLTETTRYLETNQDFETFDRLHFLRKYINSLYGLLYEVHLKLGIETIGETTQLAQSTNYASKNIFSDNFLNPYYYTNITPQNLTEKRVALGKLLFFDPILSQNNQRSCASCHQPDKAFTDGLDKSLAIDGKEKILRNAPTLLNAIYAERYFYDLREEDLERQIKHVILDPLEFNSDFLEILEKLNKSNAYQQLFATAYGDYSEFRLSKWSVSHALSCYLSSLKSFNSPFDRYVREEISNIAPEAVKGFNLFMGKAACGTCHFAPVFNGTVPPFYEESESEVLGVPSSSNPDNPQIDPDLGRLGSYRPQDEAHIFAFSFKTPTVRNIALTAPYMHNGIYQTLEEVIDFYNKGGGIGLGLDIPHQTLPDAPLDLTEAEISDLIAFMNTLSDTTGLTSIPQKLPAFEQHPEWNERRPGGDY